MNQTEQPTPNQTLNKIPSPPNTHERAWSWLGQHAAKPLSVVLTTTLVIGIALSWQTSHRWETHRSTVSEALVQTQRLAWAATLSLSEDPIARATLIESKQQLGQLFSVLLNGGKLYQVKVAPLPTELQTVFAESARWWFRIERAATTLATGKVSGAADPRLKNLHDSVEHFATGYGAWLDGKRPTDTPHASIQLVSAASTALALNTAVLVEKLRNMITPYSSLQIGAQRLNDPRQIPTTLDHIQSQIDLLINGDPSLGIKRLADPDRAKLLGFKSEIAISVKLSSDVKEILPQISENIESVRTITMESELLRRQLSILLKQLNDPTEPIRWLFILCNVLVVLGLLVTRTQYLINAAHTEAQAIKKNEQREFELVPAETAHGGQYQTNKLGISGQVVMQLANAFDQLSAQTTAAAKVAIHAESNAQQGQLNAHEALMHWDEIREQLRKAAAGLRKMGETNRALNELLAHLPEEHRQAASELTQQGREALRDSITGMVASTQRITKGLHQSKEAATSLAHSHSTWINLLERLELCAGSSSAQAEIALTLAQVMMSAQTSITQPDTRVDPNDTPPHNQQHTIG